MSIYYETTGINDRMAILMELQVYWQVGYCPPLGDLAQSHILNRFLVKRSPQRRVVLKV